MQLLQEPVLMGTWKVIWFDGSSLRETIVSTDIFSVVNAAANHGCYNTYSIIRIERVPMP
jgi:hypothetical protein